MSHVKDDPVRTVLLDLIDRCYERLSWHGPNLKGSIRGLDVGVASWRPAVGRRSIVEIVVHAAYWKYTIRRRLLDEARGGFPLAGSNWPAVPDPLTAAEWRACRRLLDEQHRRMREAVEHFPSKLWDARTPNSKLTNRAVVMGIAQHDVYHAGQIQLLKKLAKSAGDG